MTYVVKPPANIDKTSTTFTQIAKVINEPANNAATISKASIYHQLSIIIT